MIEFQYFEGCPNSTATLANLRSLVSAGFIAEDEVRIVEVDGPESAEKLKFQGSPSILLDGIDIYTGKIPETSSFTCRVYSIDGKRTGILSSDFIREKIEGLRKGSAR